MKKNIFYLLITLFALSCSSYDNPPYILQKTKKISDNYQKIVFFDIDENGDDEIIMLPLRPKKDFASKIYILDFDGLRSRIEFPFPYFIEDFGVCDIDGEGSNYFVVTSKDNIYTYAQVVEINPDSNRYYPRIPISEGRNTFKNVNDSTWDGGLSVASFFDINRDGYKDAILYMQVQYDYGERGIAILDLKNNKLLWKFATGSRISHPQIIDIDNNGEYELFFGCASPRNGLKINGMDDSKPYYLVLNEKGNPIFKEIAGEIGASFKTAIFDVDKDGQKEIIMVYSGSWSGAQSNSHLRLLNWGEKEGRNIRNFPGGLEGYAFLPGYVKSEFYFVYLPKTRKNELHVFDDKLEEIEVIDLEKEHSSLYPSIDIDGDEKKEFTLTENESGQTIYLNHEFKPVAFSEPFKELFQYKSFRSGTYNLYALTFNTELWQVSLQYNWARFKPLGIWLGIVMPWFLLLVLMMLVKRYRQRLKKPLVQYHHFDHLNTGIVFIDKNDQVAFINRQARHLLELKVPSLPVKFKIVLEKIPDNLGSKLKESIDHGPHTSFEFTLSAGKVVKHLFFNVVTVTNDKNKVSGTLITIEDLTRVIHSQRSIAWAALTQHLAHDIKNPLSNVKLILERMKLDSGKLPTGFSEYLKSIEKDINLVRNVTDSFMQFSNLSKPNLEQTQIHPLLDSIVSKRIPVLKDRIQIEKNYVKQDVKLHIDKEQITRAVDNILDNAIRAIENKGTIIISTRIVEQIKETDGFTDTFFELEIEDTGKGIKPDVLDKIFEPFVSHAQGGTGLGLAIIKKILKDHNGSVKIHSKENVGTSLILSLPLTSDKN
jgi:nitrogen-specific signal transduction histidine kinase